MSQNQNNTLDLEYILNEKNEPITTKYIEGVLKNHGVDMKVKNLKYFQKAMVHLSYLVRDENFYKNSKTKPYQIQSTDIEPLNDISKAMPLQEESYERLEFLGDAVLHNILADYLFNRYDKEQEGFMTKLRTKIENGDTLAILSEKIGLGKYVVISRYVELNGGRETNTALLEDAFEAFIGALYLDAGFDICKKFVVTLIEKEIDLAQMLNTVTNFKEKLLQFFHLKRWQDPQYGNLSISGAENKKVYLMYVKCRKTPQDEGEIVGTGTGTSKKEGEQEAAKNCLIHFGVYNENDDDDVEELVELEEEEEEELNDSSSSYEILEEEDEEEEINNLKCPDCKKEFKKEETCKSHIKKKICKKSK